MSVVTRLGKICCHAILLTFVPVAFLSAQDQAPEEEVTSDRSVTIPAGTATPMSVGAKFRYRFQHSVNAGEALRLAAGSAIDQARRPEALRGRVTAHHRAMLKLHLGIIGALQSALAELDASAGKLLAPIKERAALLTTMPGVSDIVAQVVVAEIGVDMSRFPTAGHLVSWGGLCPRNDESAGKRRSTRVRKSANWLKTTLVTAAWSAVRKKESYLRAQFLRLKSRLQGDNLRD